MPEESTSTRRIQDLERQIEELQGTRDRLSRENSMLRAQLDRQTGLGRLELILDLLPVGVWLLDRQGKIYYANLAAQMIWAGVRYAGPEACGDYRACLLLSGEWFNPAEWGTTRAVQRGETTLRAEMEIERFDGGRKMVSFSSIPLFTAAQETSGALLVFEDISERVQATRLLEQSKADLEGRVIDRTQALSDLLVENQHQSKLLKTIVDNVPAGILVADADGRILMTNDAATLIYSQLAPYMDGQPLPEGLHIFQADGTPLEISQLPLFSSLRRGESLLNHELVIQWPDGRRDYLLVHCAPIRGEQGEISGVMCMFQDITGIKQIERSLAEYTRRLERSNKDLEDFAFIASHDLQAPLRKIASFAASLRRSAPARLNEQEIDYLERIIHSAEHLTAMLKDLLAFSRVHTKTQPFRPVDLNLVMKAVLTDLEYDLERSGGKVEVDPLPVVTGEPTQLHQLLMNVVHNAIKFHRPGVPPQVRVSSRLVEKAGGMVSTLVEIQVQDNGIGFDPDSAGRLFQPFHRLVGRSEFEGSGIGLAICRKIVERHGGTISAHSQPGQGSIFTVRLPLISSS
jgi:PAS domain S-box-containing protein